MKPLAVKSLQETQWSSPGGKYQLFRRSVSEALGGSKDVGEWGGGHPFDIELARLPPGKSNFPFHSHSSQWEFFLAIEGTAIVHTEGGTTPLSEGDAVLFPPGEAHRIENTGATDFLYYVIANNPHSDICSYPETGKKFLKPGRECIRPEPADYFEPGD